jgi:PAS domain S-box-containing protein
MEPASVTSVVSAPPGTTQQITPPNAPTSRHKLDWLKRSGVLDLGGVVLLVVVATILRQMLARSFGVVAPTYITFYPAVMFAAVFFGPLPGVLTTLLSAGCAAYFFLDPPGLGVGQVGDVGDVVDLTIFSVTGICIAALAETLHRAHARSAAKERSSRLYTRRLLEAGLDPLMAINLEGNIIDVNHATEEVTGVPRCHLIGTDFSSYFTEPVQARAGYRQVFDRGQVADYPLAIRHVSGKVTDVLCHASVYRDESGAIAGICGVARDITGRKREERELTAYRQHLEELVTERTAEIQTSNNRLESANQELETFSYSVSHDLRAPLRAIDGFSRILTEEYAPELDLEGQRIVGVIREGARKMAQLIDDILAFSRMGRQEIAPGAIDMHELVRAALKDLEPALASCDVKVVIKPLPAFHGDGPMFQLLWANLLDNAIKFTRPKPEGVIEVGAQAGDKEIVYYVKDNGVGFDMQYANKLFGVFQRLHVQSEFPGTGIGLAIVKRIVARHGGRVWAEGKVNDGATIYFALPKEANHERERRN